MISDIAISVGFTTYYLKSYHQFMETHWNGKTLGTRDPKYPKIHPFQPHLKVVENTCAMCISLVR